MNPVVPKIRVGDVLHGTKNLRSYLRTCSLIQYFKYLDRRHTKAKDSTDLLYTPHKGDQFVVCVNNHDRFCVWSKNKDVVLLFVNPTDVNTQRRGLSPGHGRGGALASSRYMSPEIFPQWFIRTPARMPNVKNWPLHGHYLWAALHMNAWRNPETSLQVHYGIQNQESVPFNLYQYFSPNGIDRATLQYAVREAVQRGTFRNFPGKKQMKMGIHIPQVNVIGPRLEDLSQLRAQLNELMNNPRLMSRVREQKEVDLSFLMNVQKNPQ